MLTYRGLSGLNATLFVLLASGLLADATRSRSWGQLLFIAFCLLAFVGKSVFEYCTGTTFFVNSQGVMAPVPLAHVAGALVGLLMWVPRARGVLRAVVVRRGLVKMAGDAAVVRGDSTQL